MYEAIYKPGRNFWVRNLDTLHTEVQTTADMLRRFGEGLTMAVGRCPGVWIMLDTSIIEETIPDDDWQPLPDVRPVTTPVRQINMALFPKSDHAA